MDNRKHRAGYHAILQGLIDSYLDTDPASKLRNWADRAWAIDQDTEYDESCLTYIALVVLDAYKSRAHKVLLEMGCPALVAALNETHMLPAAPDSLLARGLEIVRDICGMSGARAQGTLVLGIGNDIIEIVIEKNKGLHVLMFNH
ncbi:MAG: hypothetical protein N3B18_08930 [Desulfobacterota bacterium]|nr:hypothetical protein [Thermodesulfobacteriota bacterium]